MYSLIVLTIIIMILLVITDIILLKAFMNLESKVRRNRELINMIADKTADMKIHLMKIGVLNRRIEDDDR